ncbi:MAG TPA: hypothetical protein VJ836_01370 [Candidatus Saccharimonadales bacterium]|nr:hypothetical protein [Candidatus Saccharimonadales bacterium]
MNDESAGATHAPSQQLIDRVVYLGQLASDSRAIDPMMDTVRMITARWQPAQPLADADKAALEKLEIDLKDYLLNRDPLRYFTEETLAERLRTQQTGETGADERNLATILLLSVGAAILSLIMPFFTLSFRAVLAVYIFLMALGIGTAWLYLSALHNFKRELRWAFVCMCLGIILINICIAQYIIVQIMELGGHPLFKFGGLIWIVTSGFVWIYAGLYVYAGMLKLDTRFKSLRAVYLGVAAVTAFLVLVPHPAAVVEEGYLDVSLVSVGLAGIFGVFGAGLLRRIMQNVTVLYAKSTRLLYYYLSLAAMAAVAVVGVLLVVGELQGPRLALVMALTVFVPQTVLLIAGYSFKKETGR